MILTKVDDLLFSFAARSRDDRPRVLLDSFGLAAGLPELVWDLVPGCVDSTTAEPRPNAFTGRLHVKGAVAGPLADSAGMTVDTPPAGPYALRPRCASFGIYRLPST